MSKFSMAIENDFFLLKKKVRLKSSQSIECNESHKQNGKTEPMVLIKV